MVAVSDLHACFALSCHGSPMMKGKYGPCGQYSQVPAIMDTSRGIVQLCALQELAAANSQVALLIQELANQKKACSLLIPESHCA